MKQSVCVALAACIALAGCGGKKRAHAPAFVRPGSSETGVASWYGHPYHGRRAANGEIYDMEKMTAAHRTLPFGTWVRVRNLENNQTVEVRITDRGPFVGGRILDLSHAAATSLAMIGPGVARVKLTVIDPPAVLTAVAAPAPPPRESAAAPFAVQVGAFSDRSGAERVRSSMQRLYGSAQVVMRDGRPVVWRVLVGREATEEDAQALAARIRGASPASSAPFVVRLDVAAAGDSL